MEQDLGIELPGDHGVKLVDGCGDHLIFWLLKKLPQHPGPVKPSGVDLNLLAVISCDDVIHGMDITTGVDPDGLAAQPK